MKTRFVVIIHTRDQDTVDIKFDPSISDKMLGRAKNHIIHKMGYSFGYNGQGQGGWRKQGQHRDEIEIFSPNMRSEGANMNDKQANRTLVAAAIFAAILAIVASFGFLKGQIDAVQERVERLER